MCCWWKKANIPRAYLVKTGYIYKLKVSFIVSWPSKPAPFHPFGTIGYNTPIRPKGTQQLFLEPEWAIDSEAIRARGIIVLVKSN